MIKDSRKDPMMAGTIVFSDFVEEASYGKLRLNHIGECEIYVYADEAPIPHFHLISKDKKFETCICIFEPLYFLHGSKTGTLNSKQRKHLNNWMNEVSRFTQDKLNNWEVIKLAWILNNGTKFKEVIRNYPQPNYSDMVNYKNTDHYQ